jgi:hypothetical protein
VQSLVVSHSAQTPEQTRVIIILPTDCVWTGSAVFESCRPGSGFDPIGAHAWRQRAVDPRHVYRFASGGHDLTSEALKQRTIVAAVASLDRAGGAPTLGIAGSVQ